MSNWNYGDAYQRYPSQGGAIHFKDGSVLKTHDIFNKLPSFMHNADLIFVDPPWNKGNLSTFYTKADECIPNFSFEVFYKRLFECIREISPPICYVEIGKENLDLFMIEMKKIYKYASFYNSSYYHDPSKVCYVVRGSNRFKKPKLDNMDEEDIIEWVCKNESYTCIGDLCMGRGLVAVNAYKNGKRFVGTELNHKRLSVTIEKIVTLGGEISKFEPLTIKEMRTSVGITQQQAADSIGIDWRQYSKYERGELPITRMKFGDAMKLAKIFNVSPEELHGAK